MGQSVSEAKRNLHLDPSIKQKLIETSQKHELACGEQLYSCLITMTNPIDVSVNMTKARMMLGSSQAQTDLQKYTTQAVCLFEKHIDSLKTPIEARGMLKDMIRGNSASLYDLTRFLAMYEMFTSGIIKSSRPIE